MLQRSRSHCKNS